MFIANIQTSAYFDSINKIPDLIKTANKLGMKGFALTDHECLSGHLKLLQTERKLKEKGVIPDDFKCVCGNEIYLVENRDSIEKYYHFILIAKNKDGHRALRELSSTAWYNSFTSRGMTRVPTEIRELEEILKKYPNSLIGTNACIGGFIGNRTLELVAAEEKNDMSEVIKIKTEINDFILRMKSIFNDDFYFEMAAGTSKEQIKFNKRAVSIAKAYGLKIVIGSDAHYLTQKERPIHKAYLNSKEGEREIDAFYFDAHMMDNNEAYENLKEIFSEEEFIEICNNTMDIYNKVEHFDLERNPIIPEVKVKSYPKMETEDKMIGPITKELLNSDNEQERYWANECIISLKEKQLDTEEYYNRLEVEADIIRTIGEKLGDCLFKYFNTFQHFIDLFWKCGSITGPGRGSAVCFLSNFLLGITQLDPVKWKLKEWRFLNKERLELPKL